MSSYIGGNKYFKWHPVLIVLYRVDSLNIGLFDGKHEALSWKAGFLVMGSVWVYLFMWLLSIFLVCSRVFLVLSLVYFKFLSVGFLFKSSTLIWFT